MANDTRKSMSAIVKRLQKQGIEVDLKDGHWHVQTATGTVVAGSTPSDFRAVENFKARLKRHGVDPDPPAKNGKRKITSHTIRQGQIVALLIKTLDDLGMKEKKGVVPEFAHLMRDVARSAGMRWYKSSDSATMSLHGIYKGDHKPSGWVMDLIEATVNHLNADAEPAQEEQPELEAEGVQYRVEFDVDISTVSLHLRVLAAILDPGVSRDEAITLALLVKGLEDAG